MKFPTYNMRLYSINKTHEGATSSIHLIYKEVINYNKGDLTPE